MCLCSYAAKRASGFLDRSFTGSALDRVMTTLFRLAADERVQKSGGSRSCFDADPDKVGTYVD